MKVGIIGCGNIADIYFKNSQKYFNNFDIIACADIKEDASVHYSKLYGVENLSVDKLLNHSEIELIINLTIPDVHFEVSQSILQAGKHSYSEKPLSIEFNHGKQLLDLSKEKNLYLGCAPDTFLGAGIQESKKILEKEIPRQTFRNGINRELAFGYQFFVLDFALIAFLEGKFYQDEFSDNFVSNVKSMLNVIPDLTDIGGNFPRYGDSDNGKGLQLFADSIGREDWLFRLGKRYLKSNVPVKEGGQFAEMFYTSLIDESSSFSCKLEYASNKSNLEFKDAGIYIMSNNRGKLNEVFVLADAGPLGFLSIAAHGHADALSFTMSISGNPIIVDPGT